MMVFPANYKASTSAITYDAAYVAEIIWSDGLEGVEGQDEIYIGSCDVSEIPAFPFPDRFMPYLKHDTISSITESFDERIGNSTIGTLKLEVLDKDRNFSKVIRRAETDSGQSIRRQRVQLFSIVRGGSWADRVKVRTLNVSDFVYNVSKNTYSITAQSVLRFMRKKLFVPKTTTTAGTVAATGAVSISAVDSAAFELPVIHSTFNGGAAVGFIKLNDEIMMATANVANVWTVPAAGRAMFGTFAAAHALGDDVSEVAVLKGNPFYIGMTVLTSGNGLTNAFDILPAHWGLGLDYTDTPSSLDIDYSTWQTVGLQLMGYDGTRESGIEREYVFSDSLDGKTLIEKHILVGSGAFGRTLGDGRYSCKALNSTPNPAIDMATNSIKAADVDVLLTEDDIVSIKTLKQDMQNFSPYMRINYYPTPRDTKDYTRHATFADGVAEARHGADGKLTKYDIYGMQADATTVNNVFNTFNAIQSRYSSPPVTASFELMPKHHGIEVGDIVGVDFKAVQDVMLTWKDWARHLSDWIIDNPVATTFNTAQGDRLVTTGNLIYVCVTAGTTGTTEPTWGASTVADGTAIWYLFDGHLSRAFEVKSMSWNIKKGTPVINCISQAEKPSFFNPSAAGGYRFAEAAYQIGTDISTLPEFTVTGNGTIGFTATQNAPVSLAGQYYYRGDVVLNNTVTLTSHTEIYAASDGTTAVGDISATGACSINGTAGGLVGGAAMTPDKSLNYPGGFIWTGTFITLNNGASGGFVGAGGNGGRHIANGVPLSANGLGGVSTNNANDLIRVIGIGVTPFTSLTGIPTTLSGSAGGAGGATQFGGATALGGIGGNSGAGLVLCARGVDVSAALIVLNGGSGLAGSGSGYVLNYGAQSGGGGGAGSIAILVERNSSGTQTLLYEPSRITLSGGQTQGAAGAYGAIPATQGGAGTIIAQVF